MITISLELAAALSPPEDEGESSPPPQAAVRASSAAAPMGSTLRTIFMGDAFLRRLSGSFAETGLQALLCLLGDDGEDDHGALDHRLPEGGDADQHQAVAEESDDEGAHDGADDGAAATAERGAAEDRRGDRVQLVRGRGVRVRGPELRGEQQAGQRGTATGDHVHGDLDPADPDAG